MSVGMNKNTIHGPSLIRCNCVFATNHVCSINLDKLYKRRAIPKKWMNAYEKATKSATSFAFHLLKDTQLN